MSPVTETKTATKVRVLTEATVEADMQLYRPSWMDVERYARALEVACREFVEHCKDHRSLDGIGLKVCRVFVDQCSQCHERLEIVNDPEMNDGKPSCSCCGALMTVAP